MTKPDGIANDDVVSPSSWGTWEELLLAFAVNRHGDGAWDSIASELQKRTSDSNLSLTAKTCRLKYLDLKRRFVSPNDDDSEDTGRGGGKSDAEETVPLLEELRKLRVAELRREVERYDLNIESLELKMKRMEKEREKTDTDPETKIEENRDTKPPAAEQQPETSGEPVAGDESDKDQLSVNESNSTDPDAEKLRTGENEPEPVRIEGDIDARQHRTGQSSEEPEELRSEPDRKSVRSDSCNGSSNSIEKEEIKDEPAVGFVESDAESDGGETAAAKENSDVQSSASRSRKEEGSDKVRRGSTSGDGCEHVDQSRAVKGMSVQSQPLFDFLHAIKSHKLGSVFERRLRSQESSKYHKTILQHLDLETIETRLKESWYSSSTTKFFRDLLLLVTNALVFFPKNSSEANAATVIRRLILNEMSHKHAKSKSNSSSGKQISLKSLSASKKDEPEPSQSLTLKPSSLLVCRKRSSIAAKEDKKKKQIEEKDPKVVEEPKITKKRTRDRFPSVSANSKKNDKKAPVVEPVKSEPKNDNKKNQSSLDSKKRGAANFLNRMKQGGSSSSNNGVLLDALKNTPLTSESSSGKGGSKNGSGKKKEASNNNNNNRRSVETRQAKEKGSPGKRNVGRPSKRGAAAPAPAPPPPTLGKRGRGETETPPSKQQPKKRTRKL